MGSDDSAVTRTNSTSKTTRMASFHYTNAEEPVLMMMTGVDATNAINYYGGGTSWTNAATQHQFYTAANNTTVTGTLRMTIDASGDITQHGASAHTKWDTSANQMIFYDGASARFGTSGSGDMVLTHSSNANTLTLASDLTVSGAALVIANLKVTGASNSGQGTDGQLLTSTGSGVAWEDAPAGGTTLGKAIAMALVF